jgi:hypothetical protein
MMKQLGGLAVGGGSILSTMWMNAMGMIDGVLANAAAGEVGGAVASGSILGLIPVTLMLFAAMLLFKGSKQSSDEKAQAFQAQRGQQGMAEGVEQLHPETLELIDEYISKIEPDADRNEMIQSVINGTIHTSELEYALQDDVTEAEYQGRKVQLGKPMQGDVKKSKVYVKDPVTGNVKKVNFGDPNMKIKKSNPERRKNFRIIGDVDQSADRHHDEPHQRNRSEPIGNMARTKTLHSKYAKYNRNRNR